MLEFLRCILNNEFYKHFISGIILPFLVSLITFIVIEFIKIKRRRKFSKKIIIEEIKRINEVSECFHSQAPEIINKLKQGNTNEIEVIVLTGMYTVYSEQEWILHINNLKDIITSEEYHNLIRYHKIYTNIDSLYPIKSYKDKIEDNKNELLKWWIATENIYHNEEIAKLKNEIKRIVIKS